MLENKWLKQIFYFLLSCYTFLWSPSGQKFWSCPCYLSPSFFPWDHSSTHYDQAMWIWLSWHGFYGQITLFCKVLTCQLSTHHLVGSLTYIHCWNISFSGLPWHHKLLILPYHSSSSFSISIVPQSSVLFFFPSLSLSGDLQAHGLGCLPYAYDSQVHPVLTFPLSSRLIHPIIYKTSVPG